MGYNFKHHYSRKCDAHDELDNIVIDATQKFNSIDENYKMCQAKHDMLLMKSHQLFSQITCEHNSSKLHAEYDQIVKEMKVLQDERNKIKHDKAKQFDVIMCAEYIKSHSLVCDCRNIDDMIILCKQHEKKMNRYNCHSHIIRGSIFYSEH